MNEPVTVEVVTAGMSWQGAIFPRGAQLEMTRAEALALPLTVRIVEEPVVVPTVAKGTVVKIDSPAGQATVLTEDGRLVEVRVAPAVAKVLQAELEPPAPRPKGKQKAEPTPDPEGAEPPQE